MHINLDMLFKVRTLYALEGVLWLLGLHLKTLFLTSPMTSRPPMRALLTGWELFLGPSLLLMLSLSYLLRSSPLLKESEDGQILHSLLPKLSPKKMESTSLGDSGFQVIRSGLDLILDVYAGHVPRGSLLWSTFRKKRHRAFGTHWSAPSLGNRCHGCSWCHRLRLDDVQ